MPRPAGLPKTGGRAKGTPNRASAVRQAAAEAEGQMPLAYLLERMRDTTASTAERMDAAKAAAPYLHPRLSAVDATVKGRLTMTLEIDNFGLGPPAAC